MTAQQSQDRAVQERLAQVARDKHARGEQPTEREARAYRVIEEGLLKDYGIRWNQNHPFGEYAQRMGRHINVLYAQGDTYGIPLRGGRQGIDIYAICKRLHDLVEELGSARKNGGRAAKSSEIDDDMEDGPALERYRAAKADMTEDERDMRRQSLLPRDAVHAMHQEWGRILRAAGEKIGKEFGQRAHSILNQAIDDALSRVDAYFAGLNDV